MEFKHKSSSISLLNITLASLAFCHFIVPKFPKGILRVFCILPIFYIFSAIPWCFSSGFSRGVVSFFLTWITSFKLVLFCYDKGPLASISHCIDFIAVALFPLKLKETSSNSLSKPSLESRTALKVLTFITLSRLVFHFIAEEKYDPQVVLILQVASFFIWLYVVYLCYVTLAKAMLRYEFVQVFNQPYLATSLQEFWGKRWNQMSSNILRLTIYHPTREILAGHVGRGPGKVVATIVTLVVSGLMHEMMFYYITCGMRPTWEVGLFFVLHGLFMVLESGFKHVVKANGWNPVSPRLANVLTIGFVLVTFYYLLFLPVWRNGQNGCDIVMRGIW